VVINIICSSKVKSGVVGPITIIEDGKSITRYVVSTWPQGATISGTSITLEHNNQIQIANESSNSYNSIMFQQYQILYKTISYTVDLSNIGCSCNGAFYLVTMPGTNSGQSGDYYCDANDVNGEWCWEMDIMEANKYTTQVTPHECYQSPGTYISSCDTSGCSTNGYYVNNYGIGPASNYIINTNQPFRYSVYFGGTYIQVTLNQNNNQFQFNACNDANYISNMNQAFNYGMVIVISYWGDNYSEMSWLDSMTGCSGDCDTSGKLIISDIEIS